MTGNARAIILHTTWFATDRSVEHKKKIQPRSNERRIFSAQKFICFCGRTFAEGRNENVRGNMGDSWFHWFIFYQDVGEHPDVLEQCRQTQGGRYIKRVLAQQERHDQEFHLRWAYQQTRQLHDRFAKKCMERRSAKNAPHESVLRWVRNDIFCEFLLWNLNFL